MGQKVSKRSIYDLIPFVRGFKAFNHDLTCRNFQFEIGKKYELVGNQQPIICEQGFHFCQNLVDCFKYYRPEMGIRLAEVVGYDVKKYGNKCVARKINIVKEISPKKWKLYLHGLIRVKDSICYYWKGCLHRFDGPAVIYDDKRQEYWIHGKLHRIGQPAITSNNIEEWYLNGQLHRINGPARTLRLKYSQLYPNSKNNNTPCTVEEYWINGEKYQHLTQIELPRLKPVDLSIS
jgi:hypothetical protein